MKRLKYIKVNAVLILSGIAFIGCAGGSAPIQIGKNTYTMDGIGRSLTYRDASAHCQEKGLMMKPLSERRPFGKQYTDISIDYKCVDENSKEYTQNKYDTEADISIKIDKKVKYK